MSNHRPVRQAAVATRVRSQRIIDDDVYEVERLLAKQVIKDKVYFLVKWAGYDDIYNTWEPVNNILDKALIQALETGSDNEGEDEEASIDLSESSESDDDDEDDEEDFIDDDDEESECDSETETETETDDDMLLQD